MPTVIKTTGKVIEDGGAGAIDYQGMAVNLISKFIDVLEAALVIIAAIFLMRFLKKYLQRIQVTHETQRMALNLLEKIITGFIIVVSITLALKIVGLDLTLLVSAGVLGLSYGLKDIIKNYVAGILILFKSPFAIGDIVKIRSYVGKVEKIEFQSTTIKTFDKKEITIHNSDVLTQPITNFSKEQIRRIEIAVTLGHFSDLKRAVFIFDKILENHPDVQKIPAYSIVFRSFSENGAILALRFWIKRPCNILKIRSEIAMQINEAFDEAYIFSPFSRSVEFNSDIGFTELKKQRIAKFYESPVLAAIAGQTNGALNLALQPLAETNLIDIEEPEEF